jgi:predicted RNA-binding Zn-ribbon protein involved in translation (DUF1610 family)
MTQKAYKELIANYKKTGASVFPHILNLGGMAIDTSQNRNKWRVPFSDLQEVAAQLKGSPLMKDHDIDHVDSIIGKVEDAWVEEDGQGGGKVMWKGECVDEGLIQKILLGYVKHNSIQIAVPQAYCDNCISKLGKKEEEATLDNLELPCPRCGSLEMVARHPQTLEQSLVAIPAYEKADITPFGFKAALDDFAEKRLENAKKAGWEEKNGTYVKPKVSTPDLTPMIVSAFATVGVVEAGIIEMQSRFALASLQEEEAQRQNRLPRGMEHLIERMGGDEWAPEPEIAEGEKSEDFPYEGECEGCGVFSKINVDNLCKSCAGYQKAQGEEIGRSGRVPPGAQRAKDRFGGEGIPETEIPLVEKGKRTEDSLSSLTNLSGPKKCKAHGVYGCETCDPMAKSEQGSDIDETEGDLDSFRCENCEALIHEYPCEKCGHREKPWGG